MVWKTRFARIFGRVYPETNFSPKEAIPMAGTRKVLDCRTFPGEQKCSVAISGTEQEVMDLGVLHATTSHGEQDTPELRQQIRSMLKDESEARAARA
jgi:hypothetical protein